MENVNEDAQKAFNENVTAQTTKAAQEAVKSVDAKVDAVKTVAENAIDAVTEVTKGLNDMAEKFSTMKVGADRAIASDPILTAMAANKEKLTSFTNKGGRFDGSVSFKIEGANKAVSFGSGDAANVQLEARDLEIQTNPHYQTSIQAALMNVNTDSTDSVRFTQEGGTYANASAGKAHGAAFAEKGIQLDNKKEDIITIGARITISEESLGDIAGLKSFINMELMGDTQDITDQYIVKGTGSSNNQLNGLDQTGQHTAWTKGSLAFGANGSNNLDVLTRAYGQLAAANYKADLIIMHPDDFFSSEFVLNKSSQNEYVARQLLTAAQTGVVPMLFGAKILLSNAVTSDKFYVIDTKKACKVWNREGLEVEFWRNGSDFANNQVTARVKTRKALTVGRPAGVIYGDFSDARTALDV